MKTSKQPTQYAPSAGTVSFSMRFSVEAMRSFKTEIALPFSEIVFLWGVVRRLAGIKDTKKCPKIPQVYQE